MNAIRIKSRSGESGGDQFEVKINAASGQGRTAKISYKTLRVFRSGQRGLMKSLGHETRPHVSAEESFYGKFRCSVLAPTD